MVNKQKFIDRIRDIAPPQGAASRRSYLNKIQEGGGAETEQGEGRGPGPRGSGKTGAE